MVTRMKISRTLMLIIGLLVLASWELVAGTSTHDIDLAFEIGKDGDACSVFTNAPRVLNQIARMQKVEETKSLSRHYMVRLVSFNVATNMINAPACLREKGKMIENACEAFSWFLGEDDIRNLLEHLSLVDHCSTNHIVVLMESAKDDDEKLGFLRQRPGRRRAYSGAPSPNAGKVIAERRRLRAWNDAVDRYRANLIEVSRRQLDEMWRAVPQDDRKRKIDQFLSPYVARVVH